MNPSILKRLPLYVLLFSRAHPGLSLAVPMMTPLPSPHAVAVRADNEFFTTYGPFEPETSDRELSGLAAIPAVFLAMTSEADAVWTPVHLAQTIPSMTSTATYPMGSPPFRGPGLVMLTSPIFGTPTPTPSSNPSENNSLAANRAGSTSRRILILSLVVGSIVLTTLLLFLILDPAFQERTFCLCRRNKKQKDDAAATKKLEKDNDSPLDTSWASTFPPDRTFVGGEAEKSTANPENGGETITADSPHLEATLPSKFSVCSSVYPPSRDQFTVSPRDSAITTDSETSTVRGNVTFAPGPAPTRPPRPPTADSPALSESVYLACSDLPYVIVAPQSNNTLSDSNSTSQVAPKRIMTPSEFFVLHVPNILGGFAMKFNRSSSPSKKRNTPRGSSHSRTKSAPLFGSVKPRNANLDLEDYENDSDVQGEVVRRVMQHRRSRSASGWAYPDRPKSRRHVGKETNL